MKILKFGGTSIGSTERIKKVTEIIANESKENSVAVVLSAIGKTTDHFIKASELAKKGDSKYLEVLSDVQKTHENIIDDLIETPNQKEVHLLVNDLLNELKGILHGIELIKECSERSMDLIMSFGERLSAAIVFHSLKKKLKNVQLIDARNIIKTNSHFGNAQVNFKKTNSLIKEKLEKHKGASVISGFIASNDEGVTTTLGRSGSDYTAAIIAGALKANELQIWSDANGVMTTDPRKVSEAFTIEQMSYIEAMEMAHFGAGIIYPPTMQPVMKLGIPIKIKNTFQPDFKGTLITKVSKNDQIISGISSIDNISLIRLEGAGLIGIKGASRRLFGALAEQNINVILITQASSEHSICLAIKPKEALKAKKSIDEEFKLERSVGQINEVVIEEGKSIVAIVGENMQHSPGVSGKLFHALGEAKINVSAIAQGSSELNVSIVIDQEDEKKALNVIHKAFFEPQSSELNLFLIGTGLIGSCLLEQMSQQLETLKKQGVHLKLRGLATRSKMLLKDPIDLGNWKNELKDHESMDLEQFIEAVKSRSYKNKILIDCTADASIGNHYADLLKNKIAVVTPNKKAASGNFYTYEAIQRACHESKTPYLYEVNVGAGLPVISTLKDLIKTGDKIIKIEAILSGTLSYIFNTYNGTTPFSKVVKQAKEKGYTEPDPRDDLNGMDVARKILILARETGVKLEIKDVDVENLSPKSARDAKDVDDFFKELAKHDDDFKKKAEQAQAEGKVLRYIASFEHGKAKTKLELVDSKHPFYHMAGSDNIVSFTTSRYCNTPLVIKGPGAGAEVTAAGVFADILRIN